LSHSKASLFSFIADFACQPHIKGQIIYCLVISLSALSSTGCVSAKVRGFSNVVEGMAKDEVIEAAGNPDYSKRSNSKDRWIYLFRNKNQPPAAKEIHFKDGHVVYIGPKIEPTTSADEIDKSNAASLAEETKLLEEKKKARIELLEGYAHPQTDIEVEAKKRAPVYDPL
jgi:outer membrane protein assembly factor BamE (lipoprotein component of BamABCDE complex)